MNGSIRTFVIKRPLMRPTTAPIASVAATAKAIFSGLPFMRMADISTASLMTEPTERSMPPLMMTKVSSDRHRAEKRGGPEHVEDVALGQEVRRRQRGVNSQGQNQAVDDEERAMAAQAGRNTEMAAPGGKRLLRSRLPLRLLSARAPVVASSMIRSSLACSRFKLADNLAARASPESGRSCRGFRRGPTKSSEWRRHARQACA